MSKKSDAASLTAGKELDTTTGEWKQKGEAVKLPLASNYHAPEEIMREYVKSPYFKTPWNHDTDAEALRSATVNTDEVKTQQNMQDETDINTILKRLGVTGQAPPAPMPPSLDGITIVDEPMEMSQMLDLVRAGQESFNALPADTRYQFGNDMAKFYAYVEHCRSTGDLEPLVKLGLAPPKEDPPTPPPAPSGGQGGTQA